MKKIISILGSTGSVGRNTLDVIRRFPQNFRIYGLSCKDNIGLLRRQIEEFEPEAVAVIDPDKADELTRRLRRAKLKVYAGTEGLKKIAIAEKVNLVIGALTGTESLFPVLEAIRKKKDIALANKELIVGFGKIVMEEVKKNKAIIIPLDSELSAIFQCLQGRDISEVEKIILTASGGPFYNFPPESLRKITVRDAIKHPVWRMGRKISVDSATLMNKGLEIIETSNFFCIPQEKIEVLIHPQAVVHSIVSFVDGISLAQIAIPDMRIPIQYALFYPHRIKKFLFTMDLSRIKELHFFKPNLRTFPCLRYARAAIKNGGCLPAVLSASDEVAVGAFLAGEIGFMDIPGVIKKVMDRFKVQGSKFKDTLKGLIEADRWSREEARKIVTQFSK